ncbi:hypothetical protein WJX72_000603 [[Myrmecia] bisecta]|uniref:Uncharacterized protein n=1 Tax=[Myrmecia] bisecta TaxID=41462 RepID=A0AAW1R407_9CHLO
MFGSGKKVAKRFSLLLLEEGEDYVSDWTATCEWPAGVTGNWQKQQKLAGRLRLCSKSLFFEPDDMRIPIVRLPFLHTQHLEPTGKHSFTVATQLVVKMKANMADAPYAFEKHKLTSWVFKLSYASTDQFMPLAHQQLAASRLPYAERDEALQNASQARMVAAVFDTSRLVDFTERVQYDGPATQLSPLVREAGRLVITDQRLYFQPLHNVAGDEPVRIQPLAAVAACCTRRSALRPIGLELFFMQAAGDGGPTWGAPSAFFAFESEEEQQHAATVIRAQAALGCGLPGGRQAAAACDSILEAESGWLQKVTAAWQHGKVSNLDYLLYCNLAAGRSFNDLTQWPVFPWVLADYTSARLDLGDPAVFRDLSKPVGALNLQRLDMFRRRFRDMPRDPESDPPFLYGTHYSCPGYVMYWLVRAAPGHLLRLQNGRFDAPDRLFHSISGSWESVLSNPADVKELIPEFFASDGSFLLNRANLALGQRQDGKPVSHVELPPWAAGPEDFLAKHRAALESPFVSANLQHWIDLMFGYKQSGPAAEEADNVFHHLTYEGAVNVADIKDHRTRAALETQIAEFGQCPRQIFHAPHPPRLVCPDLALPGVAGLPLSPHSRPSSPPPSRAAGADDESSSHAVSLALLSTIMAAASADTALEPLPAQAPEALRKLDVLAARGSADGRLDGAVAPQTASPEKLDAAPNAEARSMPGRFRNWSGRIGDQFSSMVDNLTKGADNAPADVASPTSSRPASRLEGLFSRRQGPLSPRRQPPSQSADEPSAAGQSPDGSSVLYSVSHSSVLKVTSLSDGSQVRSIKLGSVPLTSCELLPASQAQANSYPLVLAGSYDNHVYAYSVESGRILGSFEAHSDAVACMAIPTTSQDRLFTGSWDGSVRGWRLDEGRQPWSGEPALPADEFAEHSAGVWALCSSADGALLVSGTEEGAVSVWDMRARNLCWQAAVSKDYIGGVSLTPDGDFVVVAGADGSLKMLDVRKAGSALASASCSAPLRCCQTDGRVAVAGSESGEIHIWDIGQQRGRGVAGGWTPPGPDGLYQPLQTAKAKFYEEVLGFVPISRPSSFDFEGCWLFQYGLGIHLIEGEPPARQQHIDPKADHLSFQCDSLQEVEQSLKRLGISCVKASVEEAGITVQQIFFHDPDHNMIEICNCDCLPIKPLKPHIMQFQQHQQVAQSFGGCTVSLAVGPVKKDMMSAESTGSFGLQACPLQS